MAFEYVNENPGSPYSSVRCVVREANNRGGLALSGSGLTNGDVIVAYDINTRGFTALNSPNADQTASIVTVTELD